MKPKVLINVLYLKDGTRAFLEPLGYRLVRRLDNSYTEEWWLFPFNYPVRFWYWLKSLRIRLID